MSNEKILFVLTAVLYLIMMTCFSIILTGCSSKNNLTKSTQCAASISYECNCECEDRDYNFIHQNTK